MKLRARYPAVLLTSVVAGVLALIVCLLLVVDFAARGHYELFDSPRYIALKQQLDEKGADPDLEKAIRQLDARLRVVYFQRRQFTRLGVYLLLGAVIVTVITARWAASLHPRLPNPQPTDPERNEESRQQRYGRWAVAAVASMLVIVLGVISFRTPEILPPTLAQPVSTDSVAAKALASSTASVSGTPAAGAPASPPPMPSEQEYLAQWPRFRGPTGSGISPYTDLPEKWDVKSGEGVLWKTKVPLPGFNSPIVWKKHVFLSGATDTKQAVFCFDADTGKLKWQYAVPPISPRTDEFEVNEDTGYAAPTMASDGVRAYAIFASGDLIALNFRGKKIWQKGLGIPKNPYGHASSLATYKDRLLVLMDQGTAKDDESKLIAFNGATGDIVWEVARKVPSSWASPIVVRHEKQSMVVTCADPWVVAYSAEDGKELWRVKCLEADVGPSPVYAQGRVYAANESGGMFAIRAGGTGDVTDTHVAWMTDIDVPDVCSPLVTDKYVLLLSQGLLACFDIQGGEEPLWEEDFEEQMSSSPSLVGDQVYLFSVEGKAFLIKPTAEKCQRIAQYDLGEPCFASPTFQSGRMYVRTKDNLICLGKK